MDAGAIPASSTNKLKIRQSHSYLCKKSACGLLKLLEKDSDSKKEKKLQ